ncbi:MAG TPA: cardiolipin synthase [Casimicrobiaceae bacterium]|nr:cardiolipin synthase [Casimicrobiaceae bacterium]
MLATLIAVNLMPAERRIDQRIERLYATGTPQYVRAMSTLLGPPIVAGNRVQVLLNGDEIFPSMLEAIRSARRTITFETYIYWSGDIGNAFAQALSERARAGVRVHVLLDWVGSQKIDDAMLDTMRAAGAEIELYRPLRWYHLARLNNRTHRKLLIVDGRVGFTGGVGIADKWLGHAQDADHWRDTHFKTEGPVVAQMQATFLDNWTKVTGAVLHGEDYLPALEAVGDARAHMFSSSAEGGAESMQLMYLLAITAATTSIDLSSAYFVPDRLTLNALIDARRRGVKIRLIVPGKITDTELVRQASRATWGPMLEAGAEIYEYQPTMYHVKALIVDGLLVSVGSTNFDARSFRLNDEANLNVYDAAFAARQTEVFEQDKAKARRVTLEAWRERPWHERAMERAASLLSPQL